jgi:hypothetical protein
MHIENLIPSLQDDLRTAQVELNRGVPLGDIKNSMIKLLQWYLKQLES